MKLSSTDDENGFHLWFYKNQDYDINIDVPQHLYLVSDREIKNADEYWCPYYGFIYKCDERGSLHKEGSMKVEATTDKSLGLPLIPQKWIKDVYVPSNGSIKEVKIEMFDVLGLNDFFPGTNQPTKIRLKINMENEIFILPIKDTYTKDEVKVIAKVAYTQFAGLPSEFDKWFDQNY